MFVLVLMLILLITVGFTVTFGVLWDKVRKENQKLREILVEKIAAKEILKEKEKIINDAKVNADKIMRATQEQVDLLYSTKEKLQSAVTSLESQKKQYHLVISNIQKSLWNELEKYWNYGYYCSSQEEKNSFVGRLYELCVGEYLYRRGYAISFNGATKGIKDGGIDLIAVDNSANLILLIQCKCWSVKREIYDDVLRQFYGSIALFRSQNKAIYRNYSYSGVLVSTKDNISSSFLYAAEQLGITYQHIPLRNHFPIVKFCPQGYLGKKLYFPWEDAYDSIELKGDILLFQDMNSYQQYIENGKTDGDKISFFGKLTSSTNANISLPLHLQMDQMSHCDNREKVLNLSSNRICCIDFETANSYRCSACSVGIAIIENGKIIRTEGKLIKPHKQYRNFDPWNIGVHGIRPVDVVFAPEFNKIAPWLFKAMENVLVIAHNASFDISVLQSVCEIYNIPCPSVTYFCTCQAAKKMWKGVASYKLDALCNHIGYQFRHHDAASDAKAAGVLLLEMMKEMNAKSPFDLASKINMKLRML